MEKARKIKKVLGTYKSDAVRRAQAQGADNNIGLTGTELTNGLIIENKK